MATHHANGHPADHELLLAADASAHADERVERTAVEWHLEGCMACRRRLESLETTLREATDAYRSLSEAADDDELVASDASTTSNELMASRASQRARLARTLAAMPAPRRSWWPPLSPSSIAVLPPWAVVTAAVVVIGMIAPWATLLTHHDVDPRIEVARELPAASLTPGAAAQITVRELCAGTVPSRVVTAEVRESVLRAYGMENAAADSYELDALITPELGGTTDARNLWPQRYASLVWHARVKDVLEEKLAADVCAGRLDLQTAQRDLATDWVAAYRRYFQSEMPLQAHLTPRAETPELEIEIAAVRPPAPLITLQVLLVRPSPPSFLSSTRSANPSRFDPRRTS